jgi:Holliday junction resolvase-like predicted endonuclease
MKRNRAESAVRKVLKDNGFIVSSQKDERHEGVDVIAMKKGQVLLIEVKKANLHNRAWQVDSVSKKQGVVCNTIAIVTPSGIVFQPMKEHLKLCAANGMRYVTELVGMLKLL